MADDTRLLMLWAPGAGLARTWEPPAHENERQTLAVWFRQSGLGVSPSSLSAQGEDAKSTGGISIRRTTAFWNGVAETQNRIQDFASARRREAQARAAELFSSFTPWDKEAGDWNDSSFSPFSLTSHPESRHVFGPVSFRWSGTVEYGADTRRTLESVIRANENAGLRRDKARLHSSQNSGANFSTTVRYDRAGRIWFADEVDFSSRSPPSLATKGMVVDDEFGLRRDGPLQDALRPWFSTAESGFATDVVISAIPMGWESESCESYHDMSYYNGDDRVKLTNGGLGGPLTLTARQTGVAYVDVAVGLGSHGSGALLSETVVLTAAHVVSTLGAGFKLSFGEFETYLYDIPVPCINVSVRFGYSDVYIPGEQRHEFIDAIVLYTELHDSATDLALVIVGGGKVDTSIWQPMLLSDVSDAQIEDKTLHMLGYPGFIGGGACTVPEPYMVRGSGGVKKITDKLVKTYLDASQGNSGSPIYYCPLGDHYTCETNDPARIVAVMAETLYGLLGPITSQGPKIPGTLNAWVSTYI